MKIASRIILAALAFSATVPSFAQYSNKEEAAQTAPTVLTLEQALQIALSENVSVKVADKEIERTGYARQGTYSSLFPKIDASGAYQRTIKKQVMYMDFDMSSLGMGGGELPEGTQTQEETPSSSDKSPADGGLEVGRWNTWSAGLSASMPLVNAQLWKSLKISGMQVELAVEKARSSRLEAVTQVKQAFYGVLLAKEAFEVYKMVYENAVENFSLVEKKYNVQKASEVDYLRSKTSVSNAIPNVYNAESSIILALWQLKAVMGVDLDMDIDVAGCIDDFASQMFRDVHENDSLSLGSNSTLRQLEMQAEQLAQTIKLQQYANIPMLSLGYNYSLNAMTNDFDFSSYRWTPYSYIGLSLNIPIFNGGKRRSDVRQTRSQYEQLQLQTQDTERQLKIAVKNSLTTMETNMKSYYAAEDAVKTAQKGYDIIEKSYQVGRSTITDLNDAQLALTQSLLGKSQAVYNFVIAKAQLEQVLGADFTE